MYAATCHIDRVNKYSGRNCGHAVYKASSHLSVNIGCLVRYHIASNSGQAAYSGLLMLSTKKAKDSNSEYH